MSVGTTSTAELSSELKLCNTSDLTWLLIWHRYRSCSGSMNDASSLPSPVIHTPSLTSFPQQGTLHVKLTCPSSHTLKMHCLDCRKCCVPGAAGLMQWLSSCIVARSCGMHTRKLSYGSLCPSTMCRHLRESHCTRVNTCQCISVTVMVQ